MKRLILFLGVLLSVNAIAQKKVKIVVPVDTNKYVRLMTDYLQTGEGQNPLSYLEFKRIKVKSVVDSGDVCFRAAQTVAAYLFLYRNYSKISYYKKVGKDVYILMEIDEDGFAGVSTVLGILHPLIELTLHSCRGVQHVYFKRYKQGND